ncbi:MAG: RHS repeat-associated core domain-containing protein [Leptospirales bacterium]
MEYLKYVSRITAFVLVVLPGAIFGAVNSNGSFSHSVKIEIPEGRNKMHPSVSLVYNSNGSNGLAGIGWSISGIPAISRQVGNNGLQYHGNGTYFGIQGELVDVSGDQTVFHSKEESYYKYEPIYGTCGLEPKEPCGWKVTAPNGYIMYFGQDVDGKTGNSSILADNGLGYIKWGMRMVVDLHGNAVVYEYDNSDGLLLPERILYTIGQSTSRLRSVTFQYEPRNDIENRFLSGAYQTMSKRLKSVQVSSNVYCVLGFCTSGDLIRKYNIHYNYSSSTGRSAVTRIQETGKDGVTLKPAQDFIWSHSTVDISEANTRNLAGEYSNSKASDINGDGLTDFIRYHDTGTQTNIAYSITSTNGSENQSENFAFSLTGWELKIADMNGDGKGDLIFAKGTSVKYALWNDISWGTLVDARVGDENAVGWQINASDLNKDGLTDLLYYYNYYPDHETACTTCQNKTSIQVQKNTGQGFETALTVFDDATLNAQWNFSVVNLNEDYDADIVLFNMIDGINVKYLLSQNGGFAPIAQAYQVSDPDNYWQVIPADYNGDGKTDLIYMKQDYNPDTKDNQITFGLQIDNGAGFNSFNEIKILAKNGYYTLYPLDINSDRRADLLIKDNKDDKCDIDYTLLENRASGFTPEQNYKIQESLGGDCSLSIKLGEFNGDGTIDIIHTVSDGTNEVKMLSGAGTQAIASDKIFEIRNNIGSIQKVYYETLVEHAGAIDLQTNQCGGASGVGYFAPCGIAYKNPGFLVNKISVSDGRENEFFVSFLYFNQRFKPGRGSQGKALGFQTFTTIDEFVGSYNVKNFRQDSSYAKMFDYEEEYNANNQLMSRKSFIYSQDHSTIFQGTEKTIMEKEVFKLYEAGQFSLSNTKVYNYNDYGQAVSAIDIATGTETVEFEYKYEMDLNLWILDRKIEEKQIVQGTVLKWDKFTYANHNMVLEERYLNTTDSFLSTTFGYDEYGNIIQKTDTNGNSTSVKYDTEYFTLPFQEVNALGHTITYEYDPLYIAPLSLTDNNGNVTTSEYDSFYRLVKLIYPGGQYSKAVDYMPNEGNPNEQYIEVRYTDSSPEGFSYVRHYYDGLTRIYNKAAKGVILEENGNIVHRDVVTEYEFFGRGNEDYNKISFPYVQGLQEPAYKTFQYDSYGRMTKIVSPNGTSSRIVYKNNELEQYDANNNMGRVVVDARGRDIVRENYKGSTLLSSIEYTYQSLKQITKEADGHISTVTYDTLERTNKIEDDTTGIWRFKQDANGNLIEQMDPMGQKTYKQYDALNRMVRKSYSGNSHDDDDDDESDSDDEHEDHADDDDDDHFAFTNNTIFGNPHFGRNKSTYYVYDDVTQANSIGKLSHVYDASGKTSYSYDVRGNLNNMIKEIGTQQFAFSAKYNGEKKVTQVTYPDGSTIGNIYSNAGYLRQVRWYDAKEQGDGHPVVTYAGPDKDYKLVRILGNGGKDIITYNPLTLKPDSVQTILKDTDGENIVVRDIDYEMDGNGNMLSIKDNLNLESSQFFQYDGLDRVVGAQGAYGIKNYQYSPGGNLLVKGQKQLFYEDKLHPQSVTSDSLGNAYNYDENGSLVKHNDRIFKYNKDRQMVQVNRKKEGKIAEFIYGHNENRAVKKTKNGSLIYYFHFLSNTEPLFEIQVFDKGHKKKSHGNGNGNGYDQEDEYEKPGIMHTNYVYGMYNELVAQVTKSSTSLLALSKTSDAVAVEMVNANGPVGWTQKAFMISAIWFTDIGNIKNSVLAFFFLAITMFYIVFTYQSIAKRAARQLGLARKIYYFSTPIIFTAFFWFYGAGCGVINEAGATDAEYWETIPSHIPEDISDVSEPSGNSEVAEHGGFPVLGAYFFHPDHLGSVRFVSDASGSLLTHINYTPYGEIDREQSAGPDILRHKYTHQEEDRETGLYNYNARMYDSNSGRFTSADTELPGEGKMSQGFNRYMYAMGNPVKYSDPTGHCFAAGDTDVGGSCSTVPGHNYTGPTKRQANSMGTCVSAIDCISRGHDNANAALFPGLNPGKPLGQGTGANISMLMNNITADVLWIVGGALAITPLGFVYDVVAGANWFSENTPQPASGDIVGWIAYGIAGVLVTAVYAIAAFVYDTVIFALGRVLFAINIAFSAVLLAMNVIVGFIDGIGKFFTDPLATINAFVDEVDDFFTGIGDAIEDFFTGW